MIDTPQNTALALALILGLVAGCFGPSRVEQNVIDRTTEIRDKLEAAEASPERDRALAALDKVIASAGKLEPDSIADITPPVMLAAHDGKITAEELAEIERAIDGILK